MTCIELPVFRKFCFCLPLRPGLIAWGYFKLIIACLLLGYCLIIIIFTIYYIDNGATLFKDDLVAQSINLIVVMTNIVLHIIFVVGAHKKNVKILKIFYLSSSILLILTTLLAVVYVVLIIHYTSPYDLNDISTSILWPVLSALFFDLLTHAYIVLLVRSEIVKLNNIGFFQHTNKEADAATCVMMTEDFS